MNMFMKAVSETAEATVSETPVIPKFFSELPESPEKIDTPVASIETQHGSHSYLITRNESLQGDRHPITGVPFENKQIDLGNGDVIEGVFPEFESTFDAQLPEELYQETDYKQFKVCNEQLLEALEHDPDLKAQFKKDQLEQIKEGVSDGTAPDGYVWHHAPELGKIQLVDYDTHAQTGHTGGRSVWGGGTENR